MATKSRITAASPSGFHASQPKSDKSAPPTKATHRTLQ
ncbi:hypothetical protein HDF08_002406 [Edaphobacter lichenicola]|uniref:Uncharacterized protein n=1 Tax=Tunturiibacter lichenicola TaxID=2051959 RepID=A0A852VH14_9BACT|nr:hypothetical protein [Edaphobacter lichenicola]